MRNSNPVMARSKKGQLAFEFMLIYSLFLLIFIAAVFVISQSSSQEQLYAEGLFAKEVAMRFSDEITMASGIPGYEKNYSFPSAMGSVPYQIKISNGLLELNYSIGREIDVVYPLATNAVTLDGNDTTIHPGSFNTALGWALIMNENGSVVISQ